MSEKRRVSRPVGEPQADGDPYGGSGAGRAERPAEGTSEFDPSRKPEKGDEAAQERKAK